MAPEVRAMYAIVEQLHQIAYALGGVGGAIILAAIIRAVFNK
jgi:hypothetical protein